VVRFICASYHIDGLRMQKRALITSGTGQHIIYLSKSLLEKIVKSTDSVRANELFLVTLLGAVALR